MKFTKFFSNYISEILKPLEKNLENIEENKPSVILIAGVNGVGKTTTIGKLGKILGQNNKKNNFCCSRYLSSSGSRSIRSLG